MKNPISKIFLIIGIICFLNSCAGKIISDVNQSERFIEGVLTASEGINVVDAEVYLYGTDIITITDENGYFQLILPKGYEISDKYYVEILTTNNGNNQFGFNLYENQMNNLKLENLDLTIIEKISNKNLPIIYGTQIREEDLKESSRIKFKIVYDYMYDSPATLDESFFEDNGKPVPNATIQIIGQEEIYTTNEKGEFWIDKNKIRVADVILIEDEMGYSTQTQITLKILNEKIIHYDVRIHLD